MRGFEFDDRLALVESLNGIASAIERHNVIEERKTCALERIADMASHSQSADEKIGDR